MEYIIIASAAIVISVASLIIVYRAHRAITRRAAEIRQNLGDSGIWTPSDDNLPLPSAEEILRGAWDDLPQQVKNYVAHLETNVDSAGTLRENFALTQNVQHLEGMIRVLQLERNINLGRAIYSTLMVTANRFRHAGSSELSQVFHSVTGQKVADEIEGWAVSILRSAVEGKEDEWFRTILELATHGDDPTEARKSAELSPGG
jgi:hypothetical protein